MSRTNDILKILIDEKASKIVELTKEKNLTTKELAKLMDVKTSNLYYPIKKLLEINALKIAEEKQIKNMTEYYYSSAHLDKEAINFDYPFISEHFEQIVALNMLEIQKVFDTMAFDIEGNLGKTKEEIKQQKIINNATFSTLTAQIPYEKWTELMAEMRDLVKKYNDQYEDKSLPEYHIQLSSYKDLNLEEDN